MRKLINYIIVLLFGKLIIALHGNFWKFKDYIKRKSKYTPYYKILLSIYEDYMSKKCCWIGVESQFESKPMFPHNIFGVFISNEAKIGKNCVIFHHVTIGSNSLQDSNLRGSPVIGNNCYIGAGAKIIGKVKIGDNCRIGANCIVVKDIPDNSVVVSVPPRIIRKENMDNRYYSVKDNILMYYDNNSWHSIHDEQDLET